MLTSGKVKLSKFVTYLPNIIKMKKVILLFVFTFFGLMTVNAQVVQLSKEHGKSKIKLTSSSVVRHTTPANTNQRTAAELWSDDFSVPSTWVLSYAPNASTNNWSIGTTGPTGTFRIDPINSVTAANNFALFDSDKLCSGDQIANLTNATPINLSGHPEVQLKFSQYYRRYHDSTYVYVSNNGNTWTRFEVNGNLRFNNFSGNNNPSINPEILNVDISSVAGNQDSVYLRFQFYSPDTNLAGVDNQSGCAYSWMIDDISIVDKPAIDGALMQAFCGEYTVLPVLQTQGFALRGAFVNNGTSPISGARIFYTVTDPIGNLYYDTSLASVTINPGDTSSFLYAIGTYVPTAVGKYLVDQELSIPNDSDITNNFLQGSVLVDDSSYARDYTAIDPNNFAGTLGFQGSPISFAQKFHVYKPSQFTSVSFYLYEPILDDQLNVNIYNDNPGGTPNLVIGSTNNYIITVDDTGGAFLTLPLISPVNVTAGDYFVVVNQLDTNDLTLGYSSNVYTFHAGYYNLNGAGWNPNEAVDLEIGPIVRVNNPSSTEVGISDIPEKKSLFNLYPNPSTGIIYISANGYSGKDITVNVINDLGQVIKTDFYHSFNSTRIDLSSFPAGIYTINFRSASGEENKNFVILK